MRIDSVIARWTIAVVSGLALLLPGYIPLWAWGGPTSHFDLSVVAVAITIVFGIWLPRWKWALAVPASLLIAVPPWYWLHVSDGDIRIGLRVPFDNVPVSTFAIVFVVAILLFAAVFWAVRKNPPQAYGDSQ